MFEQFGSDSTRKNLDLNQLLPGANQSEVSHSILSTLFQRWLTKPEIETLQGIIGNRDGAGSKRIASSTAERSINQLAPVFTWTAGGTEHVASFSDLMKRAEFSGVNMKLYPDWGTTRLISFQPPIDFDKLANWQSYYWINKVDPTADPDYVTITPIVRKPNLWSISNRWVHMNDIPPEDYSYARQAVYPIIEFEDIQLSEWVRVVRTWEKNGKPTTESPTKSEILSNPAKFISTWKLIRETTEPCDDRTVVDLTSLSTTFGSTTGLRRYIVGTNAVRVYFTKPSATGKLDVVQIYDFYEVVDLGYVISAETSTSIRLISAVPAGWTINVCVGHADVIDVGMDFIQLHRYIPSISVVMYWSLCEYRFVGQQKNKTNRAPKFNLYDPTGKFIEAGYVWRIQEDSSAPFNYTLGKRITESVSKEDFIFEHDLISCSDNLRLYKHSTDDAKYCIWRGIYQYIPTGYDDTGNVTTTNPSFWELPPLVTRNPSRTTSTVIRWSELYTHMQSVLADKQPDIAVTDGGQTAFVSSLLSANLTLPNLIDFVAEQRQSMYTTLIDRSITEVDDLVTQSKGVIQRSTLATKIYDTIKRKFFNLTDTTGVFSDSISYNVVTNTGFPNVAPSFSQLGWCTTATPTYVVTKVRGLIKHQLRTHDSFLSTDSTAGTTSAPTQPTIDINVTSKQQSTIFRRIGMQNPQTVSINQSTPLDPSQIGAVWIAAAAQRMYVFEVDIFDTVPPSHVVLAANTTWHDSVGKVTYQLIHGTWTVIPTTNCWQPVDLTEVVAAVLLRFELDMQQRALELTRTPLNFVGLVKQTPIRQLAYVETIAVEIDTYTRIKSKDEFIVTSAARSFVAVATLINESWNLSYLRLATEYKAVYSTCPIETMRLFIHEDELSVTVSRTTPATASIDPTLHNFYSQRTPLYGDNLNYANTSFSVLMMFARFHKLDSKSDSPLRVWQQWNTKLGYETESLVVPQSLRLTYNCELQDQYKVVLKATENVRTVDFTNIRVTVDKTTDAGTDADLIYGTGSTWKFTLDCDGPFFRAKKRYGSRKRQVRWNDVFNAFEVVEWDNATNLFKIGSGATNLPWKTGDAVSFVSHPPKDTLVLGRLGATRIRRADQISPPPAAVSVFQKFYIRRSLTSNIILELADTEADAYSNVVLTGTYDVADVYELQTIGSTFSTSSSLTPIPVSTKREIDVVWDTLSLWFEPFDKVPLFWETGDIVRFVESPPGIRDQQPLYVRKITNTRFQLSVDNQTGPMSFVRIQVPGIYKLVPDTKNANRQWIVPEVDRTSVVTFDFPCKVAGVQGIIDFVSEYTTYMEDQGIRINVGEIPFLDNIMGVVMSWNQQLIKAITDIYNSRGLIRTSTEVGSYTDRKVLYVPGVELNPFPRGIWMYTERGVICDTINTPYVDNIKSVPALYDDTGRPLIVGVTPLRSDRITSLLYTPSVDDSTTYAPDKILATRHIAAGRVSITEYEHVILFENRMINGDLIYDPFLNLQLPAFDIEFQRSVNHHYRPSMNGYAVTATGVVPNFETVVENQRNDYSPTASNESVQTTHDVRRSMGKLDLKFFQSIPTTSKTEFQFWQRLIREKGSKESIERFTKHELMAGSTIDEYWALKLGTFGAKSTRQQFEFWLSSTDLVRETANFKFIDYPIVTRFPTNYVGSTVDSKWVDYNEHLQQLGTDSAVRLLSSTPTTKRYLWLRDHYLLSTSSSVPLGCFEHGLLSDAVELDFQSFDVANVRTVIVSRPTITVRFTDELFASDKDTTNSTVFVYVNNILVTPKSFTGSTVTFYTKLIKGDKVSMSVLKREQSYTRSSILLNDLTLPLHDRFFRVGFSNSQLGDEGYIRYRERNTNIIEIAEIKYPTTVQACVVTIKGIIPNYDAMSPVRVVDSVSAKVVKHLPAWDPRKGVHAVSIGAIDVASSADPAVYTEDKLGNSPNRFWGGIQVGQYWWDTSEAKYKAYDDVRIMTFDQGTEAWGQLYDTLRVRVYQWIKTTERPSDSIGNGIALSRILKKTRLFNTIVSSKLLDDRTVFTTTSPLLFESDSIVALYSDLLETATITGGSFGVEYVLTRLSDTEFTLLEGDSNQPVVANYIGTIMVADAIWDNYPFIETPPVYKHYQLSTLSVTNGFQVGNVNIGVTPILDADIDMWVNGVVVGYQFSADQTKFDIISDDGSLMVLKPADNVCVRYSVPVETSIALPTVATPGITIHVKDYPYSKLTEIVGAERVEYYHYWVHGIYNYAPRGKSITTTSLESDLTYPIDGQFMAMRQVIINPTFFVPPEYSCMSIRGMYGLTNPRLKILCIDVDTNLRSKYKKSLKEEHEHWQLFRELQIGNFHPNLLDMVKQTVVGFANGSAVPHQSRVLYDYFNNTTSRYGTGVGQVLCDKASARSILSNTFSDTLDPLYYAPVSDLITTVDFADYTKVEMLVTSIYRLAPPRLINKFIMRVIRYGLFNGYQYADIFKTSYITVAAPHKITLKGSV